MSKFYGDKDFALGYLTLANFVIAEMSFWVEKFSSNLYTKSAFLKRTREAFEALSEIKACYTL